MCKQIREAMRRAPAEPAHVGVGPPTEYHTLDAEVRRTMRAEVGEREKAQLTLAMDQVRKNAEQHFGITLTEMEPLQFLVYRTGDFFVTHSDRDRDGVNRRQVSVIVFLNAPGAETFAGGDLQFFGTLGQRQAGFRLTPQEGLLIAFRSDVPHEVETVTSGQRFTVVTWFH